MTRAETITAIKDNRDLYTHCDGYQCVDVTDCHLCAFAWLLQEIDYLNTTLAVWQSMHEISERLLTDLRAEILRVDAFRVAAYLESKQP